MIIVDLHANDLCSILSFFFLVIKFLYISCVSLFLFFPYMFLNFFFISIVFLFFMNLNKKLSDSVNLK